MMQKRIICYIQVFSLIIIVIIVTVLILSWERYSSTASTVRTQRAQLFGVPVLDTMLAPPFCAAVKVIKLVEHTYIFLERQSLAKISSCS